MSGLTLMAVHAHPDDEALSTGGVLRKYSSEGIQTVLVTCTAGELGDGPGGAKPGQPGHDEGAVREVRARELEESCRILGISYLERLEYLDSGMDGWEQNHRGEAFSRLPMEEQVTRLNRLMERYRPDVVVTYNQSGGYGHPDHIRAHQLAKASFEATGIGRKLYYTVLRKEILRRAFKALQASGDLGQLPPMEFDPLDPPFGEEDSVITTFIDVGAEVEAKRRSVAAHSSQTDNGWLANLPEVAVATFLGEECFQLARSAVTTDRPESDLFAGLR